MSDPHDTCLEIENHLPLWAGGDLESDVQAAVDAHVARCERCTQSALRARAARAALEQGLRAGSERMGSGRDPWPAVRASLRAEGLLPGAEPAPVARTFRRRWSPAWPIAAAVLFGLFLAGTWLPSGEPTNEITGRVTPIGLDPTLANDTTPFVPGAPNSSGPIAATPAGLRRLTASDPRMRDTAWLFRPIPSPDASEPGEEAPLAPPTNWTQHADAVSQERVQLLPPR